MRLPPGASGLRQNPKDRPAARTAPDRNSRRRGHARRRKKPGQWLVGFALETDDQRLRALAKLEKKSCELMVLNGPQAMHALTTEVELLDKQGQVVASFSGGKEAVARGIVEAIQRRLIERETKRGARNAERGAEEA